MTVRGTTVKVEILRASRVPIDVSKVINPGDLLKFDNTNKWVTPVLAVDANSVAAAGFFVGVALDHNPITSLNQNLPFGQINVLVRGIVELVADDNSIYYPGDPVTIGSGVGQGAGPGIQTVRKASASGSNIIGYVAPEQQNFDASAGAPAGIQAVQGVTVLQINLKPLYTNLSTL